MSYVFGHEDYVSIRPTKTQVRAGEEFDSHLAHAWPLSVCVT